MSYFGVARLENTPEIRLYHCIILHYTVFCIIRYFLYCQTLMESRYAGRCPVRTGVGKRTALESQLLDTLDTVMIQGSWQMRAGPEMRMVSKR